MPARRPSRGDDGERDDRRARRDRAGRTSRVVRRHPRHRHRRRDGRRDAQPRVRAVLHDEAGGGRVRARPLERLRHGRAERRVRAARDGGRRRRDVLALPPGRGRAGRGRGADDPARGGRGDRPRPHRADLEERRLRRAHGRRRRRSARALREHRGEIDGVVTDIVMPGLGGRGLARQIRERTPTCRSSSSRATTRRRPRHCSSAAALRSCRSRSRSTSCRDDRPARRRGAAAPAPARTERPPTCVLADDHPAVLDSVSRFLESRGVRVAQARDGEAALATIRAVQPDVAILDVAMSPLSGIDVARQVADVSPETKVILYTGHNDRGLLDRALEAGARGFVLKEGALESLEEAVRIVADGGTWVDPGSRVRSRHRQTVSNLPPLTPREREILGLVADGLTNDKVAATLDDLARDGAVARAARDGEARSGHEDGGRRNGTPSLAHLVRPTAAAERCGCRASARPTCRRAPSPARR